MKITSIDDAIKFILEWTGKQHFYSNNSLLTHNIPEALRKLDASLGGFWSEAPFPFKPGKLDHNSKHGLFKVQDVILNPRQASTDNEIRP